MSVKEVEYILDSAYSSKNFMNLSHHIFKNNITVINQEYNISEDENEHKHIKSYKHILNYSNELEEIIVLEVNLQKDFMVKKSRTAQRNFIAQILKDTGMSAALVAFYNDKDFKKWRLSFVKLEYVLSNEGTFIEDLTIPKRSSFLVGESEPTHTAKKQLINLIKSPVVTLDNLNETFGIERVTKEFFDKYKEKYLQLNDILQKNPDFISVSNKKNFTSQEFSKKLLGQIVFLYFLQKKGWLGVSALPQKVSSSEYAELTANLENENYRLKISQLYQYNEGKYIFNTTVAMQMKASELNDLVTQFKGTKYFKNFGYGEENFLTNLFNNMKENENYFEDYLEPLLYEALNEQRGSANYYARFNSRIPFLNGGLFEPIQNYDWKNLDFQVPNEFFIDEYNNGLLDIFNLFNFTVNEAEPLEQEIAIDPEMLGKIFENLLEINSRKDTGSYYTPREIVYFMCENSLAQYLSNKLPIKVNEIKTFIQIGELLENRYYENKIDDKIFLYAKEIDGLLKNLKVVDPAVGSGAFALGMLNIIVRVRNNLTSIISRDLTEDEKRIFLINRSMYNLKLESMENNIFAVDIESSAIDITKLRLWLSLIVDNAIDTVNPLPNLEYNIKVGNSLVDEYKGIKLFDRKKFRRTKKPKKIKIEEISAIQLNIFEEESRGNLLSQLNELQRLLFRTHDKETKNIIKNKIEELEWALIDYVISTETTSKNITKELEELRKSRTKPFFLWHRDFSEVFDDHLGFDIVIGNPPYGAKLSQDEKNTVRKWMTDTNNSNTAALFIDFSKNQLLRKDGILTFIVPKSLLYSERWFSLAESLSKKTVNLVDVEKAFERVKLEQVVFLYNSGQKVRKNYIAQKFLDNEFKTTTLIDTKLINKFKAWICDVNTRDIQIVTNIKKRLIPLSDISVTKRGVGIQKLIKEEGDYPVIGGRNIKRFGHQGIRGYVKEEDFNKSKSKLEFMRNTKIMSQDLIGHAQNPYPHIILKSCIDRTGEILNLDTVQNTVICDEEFTEEYVVSLLNSEFINWYTYKFIYCSAIRTMHFDKYYIGKIMIPKLSKSKQKVFIDLVRELESIYDDFTQEILDNRKFEDISLEINDLVYDLYGISEEDKFYIQGTFAKN